METKVLKTVLFVTFFIFIVSIFANINWGAPFYFHPDERNIASSISQLNFPNNFNPHFFAYGSFPIYSAFIIGAIPQLLSGNFNNLTVSFSDAIIITRIFSSLLSVLLILLIYKTTKFIAGEKQALLASILGSSSVGFLQFSNFGTFEMWLSALSLLIVFLLLKFMKTNNTKLLIYSSILFGLLVSLKLSFATFFLIFIFVLITTSTKKLSNKTKLFLILISTILISYVVFAPFNLMDLPSFLSSMNYEGTVATGTLQVFYTGGFLNTIPIAYQYQNVFPFVLNPLITLLSIPAIFYMSYISIKKKDYELGLIVFSFLIVFISQGILFVKWTRYVIPSLSFIYILISIFLFKIENKFGKYIFYTILTLLIGISFIFEFSFLRTVRLANDTRLTAADFAKNNIPQNARIISEVYDLGILPFNENFPHITLFNFYDLDNNQDQIHVLQSQFKDYDYFIIPSQRIVQSRFANSGNFPVGYNFYKNLFDENLGYKKIYETPCDIFCRIIYMGNPTLNLEQTASVFDRPTVFIFKRYRKN